MPISFFYYVYYAILLLALVTGWINYSRASRPMLFLLLLISYTCLNEAAAYWAARVYHNNIAFDNIYSPVSMLLYGIFLYDVILSPKLRKIMAIGAGLIFLFAVGNIISLESINIYSGNAYKIKTIYFFAAGSILLLQQIDLPSNKFVFRDPVFLSGLSLVWFNTVSSLYFFFSVFISKYKLKLPIFFYLHFVSNYIHYFIFFLAMIYLKNYKAYARELYD